MYQSISTLIIVYLVCCFGALDVVAQPDEKNDGKRQFSCFYWDGIPPEELYYRAKKTFRRLEFKQGVRSKNLSLDGTSFFELYRKDEKVEEGESPYRQLGKTKLPASKQVLFVIIPFEQESEARYKVVAMDDSLKSFPRGSFRFVNFSSETLMVKCGKTVRKIPANDTTVVRSEKKAHGGFVPFMIGNAQGKTVFGTRIFGQPSGRELVFISSPAKEGAAPRVKFVSQLVAPPAPTEKRQ